MPAPWTSPIWNTVPNEYFKGQARHIAADLIGKQLLVSKPGLTAGGRIVETEAYINDIDPACHLTAGRTDRTEPFFSGPGTIYVFTLFGHANVNFISEYNTHPEGILIRAIEPTHGIPGMKTRRDTDELTQLCSGPGRLTEALNITQLEYNNRHVVDATLYVRETPYDPDVVVSPRVGISSGENWPLRFTAKDNPHVSKPVPTDVDLDHDAVENAYAKLRNRAE